MVEPIHRQLLDQAWRLARQDRGRPKQGNLRRAISSGYYALFHYLSDQACRNMLGTAAARRPYRNVLARAFDHATMKSACKSFAGSTLPKSIHDRLPTAFSVPADLQSVAQTFMEIQEERHLADYDLSRAFVRGDVLSHLRDVEQAIALFEGISGGVEAQFFLVCLLTWDSLSGRK